MASDLLIYGARAEWPYDARLREWSRYSLYPQMGLALVVCGGLAGRPSARLTRRQVLAAGCLILALFAVQFRRGWKRWPEPDPGQMEVLRQVEEADERCRAYRISADDARAALGELPIPGANGENAWLLLRGSDDPMPATRDEVRDRLRP
jgi:hypothetical protein